MSYIVRRHPQGFAMLRVKTRVAPSEIQGLGLFAEEDVPEGATIWRFDPGIDQVVDLRYVDPGDERARDFILKYGYQTVVDQPVFVLCVDDARFMNHSDDPNIVETEERSVAIRPIRRGEEITTDYKAFDRRYASRNPMWDSGE